MRKRDRRIQLQWIELSWPSSKRDRAGKGIVDEEDGKGGGEREKGFVGLGLGLGFPWGGRVGERRVGGRTTSSTSSRRRERLRIWRRFFTVLPLSPPARVRGSHRFRFRFGPTLRSKLGLVWHAVLVLSLVNWFEFFVHEFTRQIIHLIRLKLWIHWCGAYVCTGDGAPMGGSWSNLPMRCWTTWA